MGESRELTGHVFISYVREDATHVDSLQRILTEAGIPVWRDTTDLQPGESWDRAIRHAITDNTLVFIACFSRRSLARTKSYQNEELLIAIEQLRLRRPDSQWFIPVRFDDCDIPNLDIGGGRTLSLIQGADLFGERMAADSARLVASVLRILDSPPSVPPILDQLYRYDQAVVADSIIALRKCATRMFPALTDDNDLSDEDRDEIFDPLSAELSERFDIQWDVLQNYAEQALPDYDIQGRQNIDQARRIIDASYDPMWRHALRIWAEQNAELLSGVAPVRLPVFEYAAAIDLKSYSREFDEPSPVLEAAFAAGRLPCPPSLITRSPELARLAMRLWRLTSGDSTRRPSPVMPDVLNKLGSATSREKLAVSAPQVQLKAVRSVPRSSMRDEGTRLEKSVVDILKTIFRLEDDVAHALRAKLLLKRPGILRRQRPGIQYGADVVFRARAVRNNSTCLVECKNYTSPLSVKTIANKVLQAEASYADEPVDHWILISPHQDPSNELDLYVQRWNSGSMFPFTIQIWSPQSGVQDLFSLDPEIYRSLYAEDPPEPRADPAAIIAEFSDRLRPPIRLPQRLAAYIGDARSFVERKEFIWLDQLDSQIERYGFDEKGAHLPRPLQDEILSALFGSSAGSNVALLLAEFGEGKSFFTVSLCVSLRNRYLAEPRAGRPIPLRLLLRGYRDTNSPIEFLRTQLQQVGLSMEDWPELIRRELLIILDGLDEISVLQDPATTRANLDKVGSLLELFEGLPVLVTSRPHFFSSGPDRERFYDRLRRPHVFRMGQPDRRETVAHLRAYADSLGLVEKLDKIKELYDPIGLAGKVLFLEMIKDTLPDLPEDRFDELVLYETYVERSLKRKIGMLRDPGSDMNDRELRDQLGKLLERIAIAIHVSGEGSVDLREFVSEAGGAAKLLWKTSEAAEPQAKTDEDATVRIGGRSLLRRISRLGEDDEERWSVDFFHRSMKEYFVAKAIWRALIAPDPFAATRELLIHTAIQPEILSFFKLLSRNASSNIQAVLASLAHSARVGTGQGLLGGGAISLYYAIGDHANGYDWRSLDLDGALLPGADLSRSDLRGSSLRGADLSGSDLTGADLRRADLTDADLGAGGSIIAISQDIEQHRYVCLTPESGLGRIATKMDGSLSFHFIPLPRTLQSPENLFALEEDLFLIAARSEFLIVKILSGTVEEVTHFRIPSYIRAVSILGKSLLGLLLEPEQGLCEAMLTNIDSGEVIWRMPVSPHGRAFGWSNYGVVIAYDGAVVVFNENASPSTISNISISGHNLSLQDDMAIAVTDDGRTVCIHLDGSMEAETLSVHSGAGTAVVGAGTDILTAGSDGSVALIRRSDDSTLVEAGRLVRRLRCSGARVDGLEHERERLIFLANGAGTRDDQDR